ncbi:MmcQ/YjbR family DNA-binding protein [Candidatus Saccharibacteria bacterium]|nr:MmcQ/YjbR family DNA-binding protein [Candidatus Saccharibacteria bacterium]
MVFDISKVTGIGDYSEKTEKVGALGKTRTLFLKSDKVFLVENDNTLEVRTDAELRNLLVEKYESVMESRYFGKGGVEIVVAGKQLSEDELDDLVRLSYNLS